MEPSASQSRGPAGSELPRNIAGGPPRNRTGMTLRSVDFESTASASSARGPRLALITARTGGRQVGAHAFVDFRVEAAGLAQRWVGVDGAAYVLRVGAHLDGEA